MRNAKLQDTSERKAQILSITQVFVPDRHLFTLLHYIFDYIKLAHYNRTRRTLELILTTHHFLNTNRHCDKKKINRSASLVSFIFVFLTENKTELYFKYIYSHRKYIFFNTEFYFHFIHIMKY